MACSRPSPARVVAAIGGLVGLLASAHAHAYCREVIETPPPGFNPMTTGTCFTTDPEDGGVLPPLYWRNQCVSFNLNRRASAQISLNDARLIATEAFAQWSAVSCPGGGSPSILATEGPDTDCSDQSEGHNNPIIFRDTGWTITDSANAIGYTTLTVRLDTGEIIGAEIEINTELHTIVTTSPPPANAYDLQSILTHEAGHFLGLAHSGDPNAVMYAFYHAGSISLQPDDISGICSIYPSDGSRNTMAGSLLATSCAPSPILGLEDLCGTIDAGAFDPVTTTVPDAGVGPLTENLWGCAIGQTRGQDMGVAASCMTFLGMLVRRRRRARLPHPKTESLALLS